LGNKFLAKGNLEETKNSLKIAAAFRLWIIKHTTI
jgi:hypothetical protein